MTYMNKYDCCGFDAPAVTAEYTKLLSEVLMKSDFETLDRIGDMLAERKTRHSVFLAGNGGSAATASHFANDLSKGARVWERCGFRVMSLCDPGAVVTCLSNDFCYEDVFSIMLETYAEPGDFFIVFSGSGNSENIIRALKKAKEIGLYTIGFGGRDGGRMKELCDTVVIAPTNSMEQIEDVHMTYVHALVCRLKELLQTTWDIEVFLYPKNIAKIVRDTVPTDGIGADTAVVSADRSLLEKAVRSGAYAVAVGDGDLAKEFKELGVGCLIPSDDEPELLADFIFRK